MVSYDTKRALLATTIIAGLAGASPALAQDATNQAGRVNPPAPTSTQVSTPTESTGPDVDAPNPAPQQNSASESSSDEIVVTGTLIPRRTTSETPSPVTVLSQESLDQRGINTVGEALQRLSANGAASIGEGWNNGSNFAAGAVAPSLRGLTVAKTLSIFDGQRMAPYPIADDGHRNFVDISTIPDNVVDRIEVLRDGASSTYGADAVAGVVNIITKKEIQGIHANTSYGVSSRGDGREYRVDLSTGYGDLRSQGFNVYIAGTYRKNQPIYARDRAYPFNSGIRSNICNDAGSCIANSTGGGTFLVNGDGTLGGSTSPLAPIVAPASATGARQGTYQLLNNDCSQFNSFPVTLPDTARGLTTTGALAGTFTYAPNVCGADFRDLYGTVRPETNRYGLTARATVNIGDRTQAYIQGNFFRTNTFATLSPAAFVDQTTPSSDGGDPRVLNPVILPVYICPQGVGTISPTGIATYTGCTTTVDGVTTPVNGAVLNPNNPFAANGQSAIIRGRLLDGRTVETTARALRAAAGIAGRFGGNDEWNYNVEATASEVRLVRTSENYIIPQRLVNAIATGAYNFVNPSQNSQDVLDSIAPVSNKTSTSQLWMVNGTIGRTLFELPGGPLAVAIGASYRHEAIDDPSANPANPGAPYERYFGLNAVGAVGSRNVKSGYFEINAPILSSLEVNASGRYDKYNTGQKNFSPKIGAKFTPIRELALRGTFSRGFRIGSFNELFGLPTTGYTTLSINCATYTEFCASHGNNTYATGQYSLGRTSVGNSALDPEKSRSFTLGAVFEPIRNISFTVDYFNIKVRDVISNISAADQTAALDAYLRNGTLNAVPGVIVVPGVADAQFPTARPLPGFVQFSFQNADQEKVSGIDFGVNVAQRFGGLRWTSALETSFLKNYSVIRADGSVERYDGTLSPCDYTSCSGSPKLRGTWQNTFQFGRAALTGTLYYTSGYSLGSVDYGGNRGDSGQDCLDNIGASVVAYQDGTPVKCKVGAQWNFDLTGSFKINDVVTLYGNVLNLFDIKPKYDPSAAYSLYGYNPAWGQANLVGRYFRIGAKFDLNPAVRVAEAAYVAPPAPLPAPAPATQTCADGSVILASDACPMAPPPPPPPAPAPERG